MVGRCRYILLAESYVWYVACNSGIGLTFEYTVRVVRGSTTQLYNRGGRVSASARALRQPNSATRVFRTSGRYRKCNPMSGNLITDERYYCRCSVRVGT